MTIKNKAPTALAQNAADRSSDARADFLAAFERLKKGTSTTVKLGPRQMIRPAMLSKEAVRARSQLYSTHADILVMIDAENERRKAKKKPREARESEEEKLRAINKQLLVDKEQLAQENYRLLYRVRELEAGG